MGSLSNSTILSKLMTLDSDQKQSLKKELIVLIDENKKLQEQLHAAQQQMLDQSATLLQDNQLKQEQIDQLNRRVHEFQIEMSAYQMERVAINEIKSRYARNPNRANNPGYEVRKKSRMIQQSMIQPEDAGSALKVRADRFQPDNKGRPNQNIYLSEFWKASDDNAAQDEPAFGAQLSASQRLKKYVEPDENCLLSSIRQQKTDNTASNFKKESSTQQPAASNLAQQHKREYTFGDDLLPAKRNLSF